LLLATAIAAWRSKSRMAYIVDSAAILAIGVATLVVVLTMIGGVAGMRGALVYNFRLVPMDQYWYFGAPPNLFLSSWSDVPRMLMTILRIPITLVAGVVAVVFCLRRLA